MVNVSQSDSANLFVKQCSSALSEHPVIKLFSGFGGLLILVKVVLYTIYKIKKRSARKAEKQRRATILSTRSRGQTNQGLTNKVFDLEEEFMSPSYVRKTLRETGCVFKLVFSYFDIIVGTTGIRVSRLTMIIQVVIVEMSL